MSFSRPVFCCLGMVPSTLQQRDTPLYTDHHFSLLCHHWAPPPFVIGTTINRQPADYSHVRHTLYTLQYRLGLWDMHIKMLSYFKILLLVYVKKCGQQVLVHSNFMHMYMSVHMSLCDRCGRRHYIIRLSSRVCNLKICTPVHLARRWRLGLQLPGVKVFHVIQRNSCPTSERSSHSCVKPKDLLCC